MESLEKRIQMLVDLLNNKVDKIAVFGSALSKEYQQISDIDIMLFINPKEFENTKIYISNLDIGSKVIEKYICSYTKLEYIDNDNDNEKPFHITFLPNNKYSNSYLWRKNSKNVKFIS